MNGCQSGRGGSRPYILDDPLISYCKKITLITFIFPVLLSLHSYAFTIPPNATSYVHDAAGVLPADVNRQLDSELRGFDKTTSTQIVVAIFKSLEGESLEDLSLKLAETWKIGRKGNDNGVLFSVFLNDRKMRIETGYGLEGVLTDYVSQQIIREVVAPHFKVGNAAEGVVAGAQAIMRATRGEFAAQDGAATDSNPLGIVFLAIFIVVIFGLALAQKKVGRGGSYSRTSGWGGYSSGGWSRSGSFGGGFSGGGGSFGGGGASGSW